MTIYECSNQCVHFPKPFIVKYLIKNSSNSWKDYKNNMKNKIKDANVLRRCHHPWLNWRNERE